MAKIGYVRCSSTDEEGRQDVARQLMGIELDKKYVEYQSGKNERGRPVFQEMISNLTTGDALYVQELSRLGRNALELQITLKNLVERGVRVEFVTEGLVFGDEEADQMKNMMAKLVLNSIASFNELFLTQTSIAVKQGQKRALKEGKLIGGSNPKHRETFQKNKLLGLHKTPSSSVTATKRNTPIAEEISKMVSYSRDTLTYSDIAEKLNSQGYLTARGKLFGKVAVKRLIDKFEIPYVQKNRKSVNS